MMNEETGVATTPRVDRPTMRSVSGAGVLLVLGLACSFSLMAAPPGRQSALAAEIESVKDADMTIAPKEGVVRMQALLDRANKDPRIDIEKRALVRIKLAAALVYSGAPDRALQELDGVILDLDRAARAESGTMLDAKGNKAALLSMLGRSAEAMALLQELLAAWERKSGKGTEEYASMLAEIATIRYRQGDNLGAVRDYRQAVEILRSLPDASPVGTVRYWQNWATIMGQSGNVAESIDELQQAARFAEDKLGGEHAVTIGIWGNLGNSLNNAGRHAEAQAILRRVLASRQKQYPQGSPEVATTLNNLSNAVMMTGAMPEAQALMQAAYDEAVKHPDPATPNAAGEYLLNLALIVGSRGQSQQALALRLQALSEIEKAVGKQHPSYARAAADTAASHFEAGDFKAAVPLYASASAIYEKTLQPSQRLRVMTEIMGGLARFRSGDAAGYVQAANSIVRARTQLVDQLVSPQQTLRMARLYAWYFIEFASAALDAGKPEDAFDALQVAQLGDMDAAGSAYLARHAGEHQAAAGLARELQDAQAQLVKARADRNQSLAAADNAGVAALDAQIAGLETRVAELRVRIDAAFPAYSQLIRPEPQPLAKVQARLKRGDALLLTLPARGDILSMLVMPGGVAHARTVLAGSSREDWVRRIRESVDAALLTGDSTPEFDVAAARALHAAIMPPALDKRIARADRLFIVTGGSLASVPMAALVTRDSARGKDLRETAWLVRRQALSTPVSLGMLDTADTKGGRNSPRFAGIGAPTLAPGEVLAMRGVRRVLRGGSLDAKAVAQMPSLPGAEQELVRLGEALGDRDALLLTGARATEADVRNADLSRFDVLAFATHGLVGGAVRGLGEPSLVLTPGKADDPMDDGLLTASDIAGLRLDADWVILSACDTAAGDGAGAPMFSGLARAFVHAGARSLLLSQWEVRDDVAGRLSVETVQRARRGVSRAEALRQAQLGLIADRSVPGGSHPAFWAPFMLIGD